MTIPLALQRYANDTVKGIYKETNKLWAACRDKDPQLAKEFEKIPTAGRLDGRVRDALRRVHDSLRKGASNSNNRGHRAVTTGKVARPARTSAQPPLSELRLLDIDSVLVDENGNPVPLFDTDLLSCDSTGVSFTSERKAADAIVLHLTDDVFNDVCSIICKSTLMEKASSAQKKDIERRYQPMDFLGVYADTAGKPFMIKSTIFHFGPPTIVVLDPDDVVEVKTEAAKFLVLSVQLPNTDGTKDFEAKHKADFQKIVTLAAGHKNLYGDKLPRWTRWRTGLPSRNSTVDVLEGIITIQADKEIEIRRKSGQNGIIFNAMSYDATYSNLSPSGGADLEHALATAKRIGNLAFGVTGTPKGFAVRVRTDSKAAAIQAINPELAEAVGDSLMALPRGDGVIVKLSGIPNNMTYEELVPYLTMATMNGDWKCHPFRPLREPGTPGTKTILARAAHLPPRDTVRLRMDGGYRLYPVSITEYNPPKKQLSSLDKAAASCTAPVTTKPSAAAWGATPKAKAGPAKAVPKREPWANFKVDEEDDGQPLAEEVDMGGDPDEEDAFADVDSGADSKAPGRFGSWPSPFRTGYAAPKARTPAAKANPFQEQIDAMKVKRQIDADLAEARHKQLEDNLGALAREVDTSITGINDNVALLSDTVSKAQAENARQLGLMADSFKEQMNQMFQLISGQIAGLKSGVPVPDGPGNLGEPLSDIDQHKFDNSYHTQGGYTDEEWDKWETERDAEREREQAKRDDDRERTPRGSVKTKAPLLPVVPKGSSATA